ncbi:MAG: methyltransferase domain-containing protein [Phycisphaerae bacterium]|nr:methyltransferase domain-containing protein [Phycisphaerae bacterium]
MLKGSLLSTVAAFIGTVPEVYHRHLGPLLFEPYAADLTARARLGRARRVLELACGTGIVTRHLLAMLPDDGCLLATDLNPAMLEVARRHVGDADPRLAFQPLDACALPFPDGSFDLVVAQFGVMFFPDKAASMREVRRVLAPGGRYLFNVWDSLATNPIPAIVQETLDALLPENPPRFLAQTPYGWHDRAGIEATVRAGGFETVRITTVDLPSVAPTAADAARGFIDGTPNAIALRDRGITDTSALRAWASQRLADRLGDSPCRATMRAMVVEAS